ncbi:hypothetical protein NDU88_004714 [Pleurodeles waltl]|uniref:Uncharacterized protein n=1 Tax=Pleurodeles waltl TaxID=8319 RepID=A0AAV7VHU5_PLEWA|nr:hypothetical protein NDU88_004714 [Pleurodeles waltl]
MKFAPSKVAAGVQLDARHQQLATHGALPSIRIELSGHGGRGRRESFTYHFSRPVVLVVNGYVDLAGLLAQAYFVLVLPLPPVKKTKNY